MLDRSGLEVLETTECIRLLSKTAVGRLVFTENALPAVRPVNFAVHETSSCGGSQHYVVVRTADGSDLIATRGTVVGFQADDFNLEQRSGWSVTFVGRVDLVDDPEQTAVLAALPLAAWDSANWNAAGKDRFIRIRIKMMRGRRISTPVSPPD